MNRFVLALAAACAATLLSVRAGSITYGSYTLAGEAGSGSNYSVCVFDFGSTAYAFGYKWDASAVVTYTCGVSTGTADASTSEAMLGTLGNAGLGITVDMTKYVPGGAMVNSIAYATGTATFSIVSSPNYTDDPYLYPNYWIGTGDSTAITSWASPAYGISARTLTNESWDGFTQASYSAGSGDFSASAPSGSFAAVPEPAVLSLLGGLGGLVLMRRRRTA